MHSRYSKILVTGGVGFIGSHLVDRLLAEDVSVVILDNLHGGRLENIEQHIGKESFRFVKGDVRDSGLVRDLTRDVDAVVHLAAQVSVPESIRDPVLTNDVNVSGTLNLLSAMTNSDVRRFVFASSCAVYGDAKDLPTKEDYPLVPSSPYGVSKLAAESYVRVFYEVFGLQTVCLRCFNVYGHRQFYSSYSGVIILFLRCLAKDLPLVIFGDGEQTRDFVHVKDIVEANILALRSEGIGGEIFNIGTGVATTINHLANALLETADKTYLELIHTEPRKGDIKNSVGDISKAKNKFNYKPKIPLRDGLVNLVKGCSTQR